MLDTKTKEELREKFSHKPFSDEIIEYFQKLAPKLEMMQKMDNQVADFWLLEIDLILDNISAQLIKEAKLSTDYKEKSGLYRAFDIINGVNKKDELEQTKTK